MMENKRNVIIMLSGGIIIFLLFFFIINRKLSYPSIIDDSYTVVTGINFSAKFQSKDKEKFVACSIENNNDYEVMYGEDYCLEKEIDGKWYEIVDSTGKRASESAWTAIGYSMPAGEQKEFNISLEGYKKFTGGKYRVIKEVLLSLEESNTSKNIMIAYFQINN